VKVRTYPYRGSLDFGPYCGLWVSQWLISELTFRDKLSTLRYALAWALLGRWPALARKWQ
jgi:hypothetical protein